VASLSRFLLLAALAAGLALSGPAWAASTDAPGQVKKQDQAAVPVPQAQTPPTPAPVQQVKQNATAPVNKGTEKKAARVAQPAPSTTNGSANAIKHSPRKRATTAATVRHAAAHRSPTRHHAARHGAATRTHRRVHATPSTAAAATVAATSAAEAAHRHAARKAAAARHRAVVAKAKQKSDSAPLTSISRAADRVVEVIPGAVILALGALAGLVLLLLIRSINQERRRSKALAQSYGVTVEALATAIEAKDHTTGGHIERVRRLGLLLAREMVPREARDPEMAYGFLLHDIGKLAVPDAILRAPGRLTEEEWAQMRRHPEEGVRMLRGVPFLDKALDVVRYHHERWDGGGYPEGLQGEEIPLWARIFSVVDALDAITAERPYRAASSYESAVAEISRNAGTQFDPAVVDALERLDSAAVQPLLEPAQQLEHEPAELAPLGPLVAA